MEYRCPLNRYSLSSSSGENAVTLYDRCRDLIYRQLSSQMGIKHRKEKEAVKLVILVELRDELLIRQANEWASSGFDETPGNIQRLTVKFRVDSVATIKLLQNITTYEFADEL